MKQQTCPKPRKESSTYTWMVFSAKLGYLGSGIM
jgi:hypothetical protein